MFDFEWFVSAGAGTYVGWNFAKFTTEIVKDFWAAFVTGFNRGRGRYPGRDWGQK